MLDVTLIGAAVAGLLSFLTPCVLPMVPFYLSYLAGVTIDQVSEEGRLPVRTRRHAVLSAASFALGVITIFMGLGASASAFGQLVRDWFDVLRWIAAGVIFIMGLHFLGVVRIPLLYREFRTGMGDTKNPSLVGAYVIGLAFAFGWTPCVGPVLAAILFAAAGTETATRGAALLFVYGFGMTLPFVLAALFLGPFMRWMRRFRRHLGRIEQAMGLLLVVFAVLIATETINWIANWMVIYWPRLG